MKVVGLTGGIGSGKSTVAHMFEELHIPVYYADQRAKELMSNSGELKEKITELFGPRAYQNQELNRRFIASLVFTDKKKLQALNELVHPVVRDDFSRWLDRQNGPYVIQENPLIFEKGQQDLFDIVIAVTADHEVRIKRVMDRDGVSRQQVLDRMQNQLEESYKSKRSDFIIDNQTLVNTRLQVQKIHKHLLK